MAVKALFVGINNPSRPTISDRRGGYASHRPMKRITITVEPNEYSELSEVTGLRTFITELAGHIATEEARECNIWHSPSRIFEGTSNR